jgi:hypothetical protein
VIGCVSSVRSSRTCSTTSASTSTDAMSHVTGLGSGQWQWQTANRRPPASIQIQCATCFLLPASRARLVALASALVIDINLIWRAVPVYCLSTLCAAGLPVFLLYMHSRFQRTGCLFWGPKLLSQIQRHVRSSRHVRIERKPSNDARGLGLLLVD